MASSISPRRYTFNLYVRQFFTRGMVLCDLLASLLVLISLTMQAWSGLTLFFAIVCGLNLYFGIRDLRGFVVKAEVLDTLSKGDPARRARLAPRLLPQTSITSAVMQVSRSWAVLGALLILWATVVITTSSSPLVIISNALAVPALLLYMLSSGYHKADQTISVKNLATLIDEVSAMDDADGGTRQVPLQEKTKVNID